VGPILASAREKEKIGWKDPMREKKRKKTCWPRRAFGSASARRMKKGTARSG
jgi:hypothetical protein